MHSINMTAKLVEYVRKEGMRRIMLQADGMKKTLVLGGDRRSDAIADTLAELGAVVLRERGEDSEQKIWQSIGWAEAIVLPTPAFTEDGTVFGLPIPLQARALFGVLRSGTIVFGGRISPKIAQEAQEFGVSLMDYMTLEEVCSGNAIPCAEGAIMLAMQQLDVTVQGMSAAVLGYGRIGRLLASRLAVWGAEVSVAVRREDLFPQLRAAGYTPLLLPRDGGTLAADYDVIFNTVPAHILSEALLASMQKQTLLIELASSPGGFSPEMAAKHGLRVLYAPGLPAKYAPRTAGALIAEVLVSYLVRGEGKPG